MLRWYQEEAINSIFAYFAAKRGNPAIAMPTGTGKSHVISGFVQRVFTYWPNQRFLILTHVKELIKQDLDKLVEAWPMAPVGVFSAGLKRKETSFPITFGGVASVVKAIEAFGWIDVIMIDECHLVSDEESSMYQTIITELKKVNPNLVVIGLSATVFRLGMGMLTEGKLFDDICYDLTGVEAFNRLIHEGFLVPPIPRKTHLQLNVQNVGISKGEYKQGDLQREVDRDEITKEALEEMVHYGQDRASWLIFGSGIEHAEHISGMLGMFGIPASYVHSKISSEARHERITAFKEGRLRALVNNNVLTTGFDHPGIDLIGVLRPTMSPVLWVQMLGRGTRPAPQKRDCLVLDFAGNTRRLGPINDPIIPRKFGEKSGLAPVKTCAHCETYNHISVRFCICCGMEFNFAVKIESNASTDALIKTDVPIVETYDVSNVTITRHHRPGSFPTMKVQYFCNGGLQLFNEFICLEHSGFPGKKARDWWRNRHWSDPPDTTDAALQFISQLRAPKRIRVHVNKRYPDIIGYEW